MKNLLIMISFLLVGSSYLYSDTSSFTIDNDALGGKEDSHYTNGLFYTWMGDTNDSINLNFMDDLQTNNAISFSHLMFTPRDKRKTTAILDDLPYAGYMKVNFLLYKSSKNYFHEFGINVGAVGPITQAKELQSAFHSLIGHSSADGWDTQLKNKITTGISYNFAKKTDKIRVVGLNFDWTNNIRVDIGNFYTGALVATTLRIGSNFPDTFPSSGNFIGGEESNLLHFEVNKSFNWAISFGLFANKVNKYYIVDEARNEGYTIPAIDYITGEQVVYDIFYEGIQYSFKIKSIYAHNKILSNASKQWGGITVLWKF